MKYSNQTSSTGSYTRMQMLKILCVRVSDEGHKIDWTKVMQIQIDQQHPNKI